MNAPLRRVAILGGVRIPFCRAGTHYADIGNLEMLTAALSALVERHGLNGQRVGDVALGAVIKHSRDWNLAREATLGSGLAPETPAYDLQRACGTSLEAALQIAQRIAIGQIDNGIAGGSDSISDAPIVHTDAFARILKRSHGGKTLGARLKPWLSLRPRHLVPQAPGVVEPRTGLSMGEHCELMAKEWKLTQAEQDALALASHQRAAAAWDEGFYASLVVPFHGAERDGFVRKDTTLEKLATLRPAFDRSGSGTLTAGNSTPLTDGAATVLLASEDWAQANGHEPQAWLVDGEIAAVDFVDKGEGLLMAPAYAVPRLLARNGLTLQDFDYYEIHEAFAAQVLCTLGAWESAEFCRDRLGLDAPLGTIDRSRLNVKGGSVALGHPFGATGARVLANAAQLLNNKGSGRALVSVCTGGGMGVTAIVER
jgi:acetyl-CoA C-acetyltransferase